MLKKIIWLALLISFIFCTAPYAKAATIDYAHVWRDNIVYETGAFTGVQNRDTMKASAELSSVPDPNDYSVHLTSGVSGPVDTYLGSYRDHGGGSYEYVNTGPLAAPGPAWEGFTYTFDLFNVSDSSSILATATWTIPAGSVTNPVAIPTWTSFSGDLLNPTISWEPTIAPSEGKYKLRIYELNPDGSFNYQAITHSTPQFETTTYTLDDFTLEYGKSYAIGIQSIIIHPDTGGTLNRSQYYIRYAAIATPATAAPCDINGDGKMGLEEAIHALQVSSGLKPVPVSSSPAPVAKTGQTSPYAPGDDGDLEAGVAWPNPRFTDNGDGTVKDNLTGLIWLKDANCINSNYPGFDTDGTAGDGTVKWQHALDFVAGINAGTYPDCGVGHTDWRLPNVKELQSLIDFGNYDPAMPTGHPFTGVQSNYYWSGTTYAYMTGNAWLVGMDDGYVTSGNKAIYYYVWPVRGDN